MNEPLTRTEWEYAENAARRLSELQPTSDCGFVARGFRELQVIRAEQAKEIAELRGGRDLVLDLQDRVDLRAHPADNPPDET